MSSSTCGDGRAHLRIGGSRNWEDGRSTGKVFSGLRRMSEDSGAGTQPGSCGPQEGIPGASLDSSPKAGEHNFQVMLWLGTRVRVPQTCRICVESVCITCICKGYSRCV
eukprot:scaffold7133_cov147-Isochrysis_galbana.AAC.5